MKGLEYAVTEVELDLLKAHPRNNQYKTPLDAESEEYQLMRTSIATNGLIHPLIVQASTNIIISGHTRWRIAKELGMTKLPVRYLEQSDEDAENLLVSDNIERAGKETDLIKLARSVDRLAEKYSTRKEAYEKLSGTFAIQYRQLDRLRSLLKLIPELQELVSMEHVGLKAGTALAALDVSQQQKVINYLIETGKAEKQDWKLTEKEALHFASKIREIKLRPEPTLGWDDNNTGNTLRNAPEIAQRDLEPSDRVYVPETTYEPQTREEELSSREEQTNFEALNLLERDIRTVSRILDRTAPIARTALESGSVKVKEEISKLKKILREAINAL
jgi:ParB family chromosome partitioning protein